MKYHFSANCVIVWRQNQKYIQYK